MEAIKDFILGNVAAATIIWVIREERNTRIFSDKASDVGELWDKSYFSCFDIGVLSLRNCGIELVLH